MRLVQAEIFKAFRVPDPKPETRSTAVELRLQQWEANRASWRLIK